MFELSTSKEISAVLFDAADCEQGSKKKLWKLKKDLFQLKQARGIL